MNDDCAPTTWLAAGALDMERPGNRMRLFPDLRLGHWAGGKTQFLPLLPFPNLA